MQKRIRIGVDVGGTFTDFVLVDEHRDMIFTGKQLTTPTDPGKAICEGVARIALEAGVEMSQLDGIVHGTSWVRLFCSVGCVPSPTVISRTRGPTRSASAWFSSCAVQLN